ncbi:MAG: hypothetical protein BM557_08525 [Flavobacterium sp. MedPE-SWcel]|uniref:hypothetical protein n=1 Tax=uncultured Flavobacterium sp. TaxID=165435 RepID=UPI0009163CE0|nr:hypothetical protein [uncultured Flavobacterium sp.]OIQ17248.1 MAG: hypothetical protein BM557_08525 [Flavobacterium sp. MedPE-SWcel]
MKQTFKKITLCTIVLVLTLFTSCQKDDSITTEDNIQQKQLPTSRILTGTDARFAIEIFNSQMTKINLNNNGLQMKGGDTFTIDDTAVLEVKSHKGKTNYTFRVNHSLSDERTFFNVVITEQEGLKKTSLIRYEMDAQFAHNFNSHKVDFAEMDGLIFVNTLHADDNFPCNDSPGGGVGIPITGGAGSGSSGGGGTDPNGNGNPHNENMLLQMYAQLEMSLSYSAGNADSNGNGGGNDNGGDDDKWLLISRSPRYLSVPPDVENEGKPCAEGEEIGILLPFLNSQIIVNRITDENLEECSKDVLNSLKLLNQSGMANMINQFDDSPSIYNVDIRTEAYPTPNGSPAQTRVDNENPYSYIIRIHPEYTTSTNKLGLATLILHEMIHAYFLSLLEDANTSPLPEDRSIQFEAYVIKNFGATSQNSHHEIMATKYVDILSRALQEYNTGIEVPENTEPDQLYKDLAWGGLQDAPIYNTTNELTEEDRVRINKRYAAELFNITFGTEVPAGEACP